MNEQPQTIAGLTKEEFDQKNAANGGRLKIFSVTPEPGADEIDIIIRPMTRAEYQKSQSDGRRAARENTSTNVVFANMVRSVLIAPQVETFDAYIERYPALAEHFADKVSEMAGSEAQVREKSFR